MRQAKLAHTKPGFAGHDQRPTTRSERNYARNEVTSCAKPYERSESATTQVKVLSPEIFLVALGQGFHVLEASSGLRVMVSASRRAGV